MTVSRYASLTHDELAVLVPELLLIGHLIDRSGMAWCIAEFGREQMVQIAIEEWAGSSPVYTRRMQRALGYGGDDVVTIFKGLQFDIGSPPQFMDFRFTVHDRWHGEFELASCGALLDVEPMGDDYVRGMCHTIEDPTFDATAVATNPYAQCRPVHRPPRSPSDRTPHCRWTVVIDKAHPPAQPSPALAVISGTRAAGWELDPIDGGQQGLVDYSGPLLSDVDFAAFSHGALVRIADEVCLQMHLLYLSFALAVRARVSTDDAAAAIGRRQLTGLAGLAGMRIANALKLSPDVTGALRTFELHPLFNPTGYVCADFGEATFAVQASPANADGAWITLCSPQHVAPLQAIATAVNPRLRVQVSGSDARWEARLAEADTAVEELPEVMVTKLSQGADFVFRPRVSLPLTVV